MTSGQPAMAYHMGSYTIPALYSAVTGISCYLAFTSLLVPLGVVLTGLAAFSAKRGPQGARGGRRGDGRCSRAPRIGVRCAEPLAELSLAPAGRASA